MNKTANLKPLRPEKRLVEQHHNWKEQAYKGVPKGSQKGDRTDEHGNLIRPKYLSNHTHYSPTDPDAKKCKTWQNPDNQYLDK
ncbi:MAG: hypothetical protein R2805_11745 [Flavobacterium sp.]|uniref:hypothetical protein n=1 Tax=Flavobacterium sp. TaxID=239 RepID=UPI003527C98F